VTDTAQVVGIPAAVERLEAEMAQPGEATALLVVDLSGPGDPDRLRVPTASRLIVVGVGGPDTRGARGAEQLDLNVTHREVTSPCWVRRPDVEGELVRLDRAIRLSPDASAAYAQVLRVGGSMSVEQGLLVESLAYSTLQSGPEFAGWIRGRTRRAHPPADGEPVLIRRRGDRLEVTLNRAHVHNAYNAATREGLCEAFALARLDGSIAEVVLAGRGPSFCSGGDLDEFGTFTDPVSAHLIRTARSPARLIHSMRDRVVAVIHGWCVGSGIELPAFAGRVVADMSVRIRLPELAMGLIPGAGGTVSLPARAGRHRTAWLGLTGTEIPASTAYEWGLIDEIVELGTLSAPAETP
jgi:enoyl-CoA hydratase/carnithine racemase